MRNVYYNEETRTFGISTIVDRNLGKLDQLFIHILKLIYAFDYERDRDAHCMTLNTFTEQLRKICESDKELTKRRGKTDYTGLILSYTDELDVRKLRKIRETLVSNYGFKGYIDRDEKTYALTIMHELLSRSTKSDRMEYLEETFPPSDRKFSLMIHRLTRNRVNSERKSRASRLKNLQ